MDHEMPVLRTNFWCWFNRVQPTFNLVQQSTLIDRSGTNFGKSPGTWSQIYIWWSCCTTTPDSNKSKRQIWYVFPNLNVNSKQTQSFPRMYSDVLRTLSHKTVRTNFVGVLPWARGTSCVHSLWAPMGYVIIRSVSVSGTGWIWTDLLRFT